MRKTLPFLLVGILVCLLTTFGYASEANSGDLTPLKCWPPDDISLDCTELTFDPEDFLSVDAALGTAGELLRSGALQVQSAGTFQVRSTLEWDPDECAAGTLKRIFSIFEPTEHGTNTTTCTQTITILNKNDYLIKFPADASETCGGDGGNDLVSTNFGCDILAVHRDTSFFGAAGDACFKRRIIYSVINWCEYDGRSLNPTIIPRDVDCDGNVEEPTWIKSEDGDVWIDDDDQPKDGPVISFKKDAASYQSLSCDGKSYTYVKGYWQYTQFVKVYDDEAPIISSENDLEFCANGASGAADCNAEVMIPFTANDLCTENVEIRSVQLAVNGTNPTDLTDELYTVSGSRGSFAIQSIAGEGFPVGAHYFTLTVADECGNITNWQINFSVKDCKTPAPICTSILSVDLMPVVENKEVIGGMTEVWAIDFVASGVIDCTPHPQPDAVPGSPNNVRYFVVRKDSLTAAGLEAPTADYLTEEYRSVVFTCEDNGATIDVYVIGLDGAGNFDFCTVMVSVQPGVDPDPCTGEADTTRRVAVAGFVSTPDGHAVEGVEVALSGQLSNALITGESGAYFFSDLQAGYDYSITPSLEEDAVNGVSTFDLVTITKHILGVEALDSPYKLLAADVNNSQSITTSDLIQIRKLILNIDDEFSQSSSWIFFSKDHSFENPADPWSGEMPAVININNLQEDMLTGDFMAVKKGDVNGSVKANSGMSEPRNVAGTFQVSTLDIVMTPGNEYTIPFTAENLKNIQGYQFTLNFDPAMMEIVDVQYGVAKENHFGFTHIEEGVITTSWNDIRGAAPTDTHLFSLIVRSRTDAQLSDLISINSRYTVAEAYGMNNETLDVKLNFDDARLSQPAVQWVRNQPNPFVDKTQVRFHLTEAAEVRLRVFDTSGKTLSVLQGMFGAGENHILLQDLPTGVLYYTLQAGEFVSTQKMIHLK
jgi:hypothetical protein